MGASGGEEERSLLGEGAFSLPRGVDGGDNALSEKRTYWRSEFTVPMPSFWVGASPFLMCASPD